MVAKSFGRALALLLLCPPAALALGLGDIRLLSSLNAPLNAEIELVDVAPEVGSMIFASGSNHLGDLGGPAISDESEAMFAASVRERKLPQHTYGALAAGDATFHAGWTLHRAGTNPTNASRPVMTIIYYADGARLTEPVDDYQRWDLALWLKGSVPGELANGERNPLLWP